MDTAKDGRDRPGDDAPIYALPARRPAAMSTTPRAFRIRRIGLCVADLAQACDFYERSLGFRRTGWETRKGAGFGALTGLADARAEVAVLQLGGQTVELAAFSPEGRTYPSPRAANDPWFHHF